MSRQIEGQMSIFDILMPENDKKLQKTTENGTNLTVLDSVRAVYPWHAKGFKSYGQRGFKYCRRAGGAHTLRDDTADNYQSNNETEKTTAHA
jgi:hypothetical protein